MSRDAWLTPDEITGSFKCFRVFCPEGERFEAALRGAIAPLSFTYNWELYGDVEPLDAAGEFIKAFQLTTWEECGDGETMALPVGSVFFAAFSSEPDHCLRCDGAAFLRTEYAALFAAIGTAFGAPDGDHFCVPDIRGRSPLGEGTGPGLSERNLAETGGEQAHQLTVEEMPAHTHGTPMGNAESSTTHWAQSSGNTTRQTGSSGGDKAHENMHPFLVLSAFIVAE